MSISFIVAVLFAQDAGAAPSGPTVSFYVTNIILFLSVLFFSVLISWFGFHLRQRQQISAGTFFKIVGISLVVSSGMVLTGLGTGTEVQRLMMNILAAIAGYVFGRSEPEAHRDSAPVHTSQ
jgi:hypothetical protein